MTEDLFETMLRDQVGTDPDDLATLLSLVAIGIVNGSWRNSCVENWHAEGRLSDGDMMRINSRTTQGIRQRLRGWTTEFRITAASSEGLAGVTVEDVEVLTDRLFRWLTNPRRELPTGSTLSDLARTKEDLEEYEEHADRSLGAFVGQMEKRTVRHGLLYTACHGALACQHWWGHPTWTSRVDHFVAVLDNPSDAHWGTNGDLRERLLPEPAAVRDRSALWATLLRAPWELDGVAAEWITDAGIRYVEPVAS